MSPTTGRYEGDVKPLKLRFLIAAALFIVLATVFSVQERERRRLEKTSKELIRAKEGLARVKQAVLNRKNALDAFNTQLTQETTHTSPERLVYARIDDVKKRFKPDDMIITPLERKGGDVSLKYTLKFNNPNYCDFLNAVSYLQRAAFPFTPVNSISISQAEVNGKGTVAFTIDGTAVTPERVRP